MLDRLERLPAPQRDALADGVRADAPGRRRIASWSAWRCSSLLSEVAEEQPLSAWSTTRSGSIARRRRRWRSWRAGCWRSRSALVFAVRDAERRAGAGGAAGAGRSRACATRDARALLDSAIPGPLDERVRDRIVAETRGNPLALLELPRGLTPAELAGGFGLPDALPLAGPDRGELPAAARGAARPTTRRLLLVAAAEPVGRSRAAVAGGRAARDRRRRGGAGGRGRPARVRRPGAVPPSAGALGGLPGGVAARSGRASHRALAEATDPELDPDRRAWHRAQAAPGPDEDVAAELERSAGRAQARGGARGGRRVPGARRGADARPGAPGARALAAAQAKHEAGAPDAALEPAGDGRGGTARRARSAPARTCCAAQIAFAISRGSDAPPLLLDAAKRLEPLDAALARETYLEALLRRDVRRPLGQPAPACWRSPRPRARHRVRAEPPRASDLLLDGLALLITEGYAAGGADARAGAARVPRPADVAGEERVRWLWLAVPRRRRAVGRRDAGRCSPPASVQLAREAGALAVLPIALTHRIGVHLVRRRARRGRGADRGGRRRSPRRPATRLAALRRVLLAAWRGRRGRGARR